VIASPLRPRHRQEPGIAAAGQLAHQGTPYGASLSFATTTHLWPLSDPPSRKPRSATSRTGIARSIPGRALASSVLDSPCQGSKTGLPPPISTSVPGTPDRALALRARPSRRQPRGKPSKPGSGTIRPAHQPSRSGATSSRRGGAKRSRRSQRLGCATRSASSWNRRTPLPACRLRCCRRSADASAFPEPTTRQNSQNRARARALC